MAWCIFISAALLSGCATVTINDTVLKRKVAVTLVGTHSAFTDYWVASARPWQCDPPQVRGEGGYESPEHWEFGLYHESFPFCGTVNHKPEIYEGGWYFKKTWGGY